MEKQACSLVLATEQRPGKRKWLYLLPTGSHKKSDKSHPNSQASFSLIKDNIAFSISHLKHELGFSPSISELKRVLFVLFLLLFMKLFLSLQRRMIGNAGSNSSKGTMWVRIEALWAECDPALTQMHPSRPVSFAGKPQRRVTVLSVKKMNAFPAKRSPF